MSSKMTPEERKIFEREYARHKKKFDADKQEIRNQKIKDFAKKKAADDSKSFGEKVSKGMMDTAKSLSTLGKELSEGMDKAEAANKEKEPEIKKKKAKKKQKDKSYNDELKDALLGE